MARRIIQFGTSRFLQAHVDLFVHEARAASQNIGPISVVKTTPGSERTSRIEAMRQPGGFPVRIRGYRNGGLVDEEVNVRSIDQALSAHSDWPEIVDLFRGEVEIAVSNVGDQGYDLAEEDIRHERSSNHVPTGFPAKLLLLLLERFEATANPLLFLPCELMRSNGRVLRQRVATLAAAWQASDTFMHWLENSVVFADTLVDRIVAEEILPVGAVAEPYALWAIRERGFKVPLTHPAVVLTDDLEPYERLKLHILNLGHTVLAEAWIRRGRPARETVSEIMAQPRLYQHLSDIYATEVIPGFAARGMAEMALPYVGTTIERLRNPFLNHRIADIAQNHSTKVDRRIRSFLAWVRQDDPLLRLPQLTALAAEYAQATDLPVA